MNISDPIADMLTRVRNASRARHTDVVVPASRTKREIARILKDKGFIADVTEEQDGPTAVLLVRPQVRRREGASRLLGSSGSASPVSVSIPARRTSRASSAAWASSSSARARGS